MQIITRCPNCGTDWTLDGSSADRRVRCRKCGALFKVPKLSELPDALKVIERSAGAVHVDKDGKTYG